jgi:dihydrofolate synthase/folylpolyglutamate synthase
MNYQQTLDYLFSRLPMFHRVGGAAYKADLNNTLQICKLLGNPEKKFRSIHIAGTNGKGSVSNMIAAVLQTAGYKTGLYTSPHLSDFRERIRINGKKIPKGKVVEFVKSNKLSFESVQPSFFEYTFGMAMQYFAEEHVDIAVIETGMGGRLDSTNVVDSILSVITNIGFDHTQFLGDTLVKIATEKAGIIKKNVPVIIGETQYEVLSVFIKTAREVGAQLIQADQNLSISNIQSNKDDHSNISIDVMKSEKPYLNSLKCDLTGNYQYKNIITVIQVFDTLQSLGYSLTAENIYSGISNVRKLTGFQGRWQIIGKNPLIICDIGHNVNGIREVIKQLQTISYQTLHIVLGFVQDKKLEEILPLLPQHAIYYFCKANIPRGLDQNKLLLMCKNAGLLGRSFNSVKEAFESAKRNTHKEDLIFIGGSTFVVAEVI